MTEKNKLKNAAYQNFVLNSAISNKKLIFLFFFQSKNFHVNDYIKKYGIK
jgi:hypothetical protein